MKILRKSILFILIFFLLLGALSYGTMRFLSGCGDCVRGRSRAFARVSEEKKNSLDVIFLGDSESYCTFSPMELWSQHGIASYNCGQGSQRIQETYYMLKTVLQTQSPKVVVLETNVMFRDPGLAENILLSLGEPLRYHFPLLRYHNLWKTAFDGLKTDKKSYKGFPLQLKTDSYTGAKDYMQKTDEAKKLPPHTLLYMDLIRRLCTENNASLVLVSAPSPVNSNYKKHNALESYAHRYGLTYLNLNLQDQLEINWETDTMDKGDHLNIRGAKKASAFIGTWLKNTYDLPDHRGDAAYKDWDTLLTRYQAEISSGADAG